MKRQVSRGARLRTATRLPKRELLRRVRAAQVKPKQEKPND